jgi:hypothetical protein
LAVSFTVLVERFDQHFGDSDFEDRLWRLGLLEEHFFTCPYCWQEISMLLDLSAASQSYVEDCEVCCNPISINFEIGDGAIQSFHADSLEQ